MGIPGLADWLRSCIKYELFFPSDPKDVVIDGPALAYYVWRHNRFPVECGEYGRYADALREYLLSLQRLGGFRFKMAFFDGKLPEFKVKERCARMNNALTKMPKVPPPFAAMVAQDVLTEFCDVRVVPGEADGYCALAVNNGGIVLSLDSDLYIYNLASGAYLPLDKLETRSDHIVGGIFTTKSIQHYVHDPLNAAYTVSINSRITYPLLQAPQGFRDKYKLPNALDCLCKTIVWGRFAEVLSEPHHVYLPFLPEDRDRASAWEIGLKYRAAAYIGLIGPSHQVFEILRRGQRMVTVPIDLQTLPFKPQIYDIRNEITKSILRWYEKRDQNVDETCLQLTLDALYTAQPFPIGEQYRHLCAQVQAGAASILLYLRVVAGWEVGIHNFGQK